MGGVEAGQGAGGAAAAASRVAEAVVINGAGTTAGAAGVARSAGKAERRAIQGHTTLGLQELLAVAKHG